MMLRIWHLVRARRIRGFVYDKQPPALMATMDLAASMRQV
jgi:hypothetical protein